MARNSIYLNSVALIIDFKSPVKTLFMVRKKKKIWGDPEYPESEDIFSRDKKTKLGDETTKMPEGLDVPGAELDDKDEEIGEEDEENNYYSLGGDDHNDLDEREDNEGV